jgi:hypothetical protein
MLEPPRPSGVCGRGACTAEDTGEFNFASRYRRPARPPDAPELLRNVITALSGANAGTGGAACPGPSAKRSASSRQPPVPPAAFNCSLHVSGYDSETEISRRAHEPHLSSWDCLAARPRLRDGGSDSIRFSRSNSFLTFPRSSRRGLCWPAAIRCWTLQRLMHAPR